MTYEDVLNRLGAMTGTTRAVSEFLGAYRRRYGRCLTRALDPGVEADFAKIPLGPRGFFLASAMLRKTLEELLEQMGLPEDEEGSVRKYFSESIGYN